MRRVICFHILPALQVNVWIKACVGGKQTCWRRPPTSDTSCDVSGALQRARQPPHNHWHHTFHADVTYAAAATATAPQTHAPVVCLLPADHVLHQVPAVRVDEGGLACAAERNE
jgi:hypothetical protein